MKINESNEKKNLRTTFQKAKVFSPRLLFKKQVTTLSFWRILLMHKLQMLAQQLRGTL